jgi:hypothetical protein
MPTDERLLNIKEAAEVLNGRSYVLGDGWSCT